MKVKTYGINGLSEWHGQLAAGTIKVNVSFVGGTASPGGMKPAYMTTKDPIVQFVVEHSTEYKRGDIFLVSMQEMAGSHPRMAVPKAAAVTTSKVEKTESNNPKAAVVDNVEGNPSNKKIEVADKSEAIEWLKEHYPDKGYTANKLKREEPFMAACNECGVEFVW